MGQTFHFLLNTAMRLVPHLPHCVLGIATQLIQHTAGLTL